MCTPEQPGSAIWLVISREYSENVMDAFEEATGHHLDQSTACPTLDVFAGLAPEVGYLLSISGVLIDDCW